MLNEEGIEYNSPDQPAEVWKLRNARTNSLLHELTHLLGNWGSDHCGSSVAICVWRSQLNDNFYEGMHNTVSVEGVQRDLPWHSLDEINAMRRALNIARYKP